jgi:hypothetical protein
MARADVSGPGLVRHAARTGNLERSPSLRADQPHTGMPDMSEITLSTHLSRVPDLIATEMDGDLVMMSIEKGQYFGIGGIGSRVWTLLETPMSIADLARIILQEYEVDEVTCQADLLTFAQDLLDHGVVRAS